MGFGLRKGEMLHREKMGSAVGWDGFVMTCMKPNDFDYPGLRMNVEFRFF